MSIPAKHRDALLIQCEGRLTLTKHPDGCLLMYPRHAWEAKRDQIAAWPMAARGWQRILLGNAVDVEMDSAGRILVAPELRTAAGLGREVVLSGMLTHFEIWDPVKRDENEQATIDAGMPANLSDFAF
ncbi:MraZ protein [Pseudoduganella lurida]|uniref:Transcriptional regulator MraZ n=2 Tax=Pseudoduganella lurida TaxID=1036180 RepID=A0A562R4Y5_9BURK|nr:MraZ protein [Pseudoduganella lurida]